jgi:cell division protein FtsL
MTRRWHTLGNAALLALTLATALCLVKTQYTSRQRFVAHEQAQSEGQTLTADNERLRAMIREESRPDRIERIAKRELNMQLAGPAVTLYSEAHKP